MGEDAKTEDPKPQEQRPDMAPAAAGEDKKDTAAAAITLKLNLHCDCCAKNLKRSIRRNFAGVEEVITDLENSELTVKGRVDPTNLIKKLEEKTGKKIQLLSPLSMPAAVSTAAGGNKKADVDSEKQAPEQSEPNKHDKQPKEIVVTLKIRLHCEGCMHKIKRVIKKYDGVKSIDFEATKNLVKVVGVMDMNALVSYLKDKLKRNVEVIPLKKDTSGDGKINEKKEKEDIGGNEGVKGDAKEKEFGDEKTKDTKIVDQGSSNKKEKENKDKGVVTDEFREEKSIRIEETKVEANKMEYYGQTHNSYYSMPPSMPINHVYINHGYRHDYGMSSGRSQEYKSNKVLVNYPNPYEGYYNLQQYPQSPGPYAAFSDENPNASCYVM